MALGITKSREELIATLGENGELECKGTLKDGRVFHLTDGKLKVDNGAGSIEEAKPEEINEVLMYLEVRFGNEKIHINSDNKIIFARNRVEKLADDLAAAKKGVKNMVGAVLGEDTEPDPLKKRAHSIGMVSTARRLILEGKSPAEIETHLKTEFNGVNSLDLKVDEAINEAKEAARRMDRAKLRVAEEKLVAKIRDYRAANPTHTKEQIEAALRPGVKNITVKIAGGDKPIERSDHEVEEILEAAFAKEASEDLWKRRKTEAGGLLKSVKENGGTAAKWGALGLAGAATLTAAGVLGAGALLWKGLKAVGPTLGNVAKKTALLTLNVGKHLVSDGKNVVVAAGQTFIVNPVKAVGRVVSSPFIRGFQGARWGLNYPEPATQKPVKSFLLNPLNWTRNKIASGFSGFKKGSLALMAGALFTVYGAGEGVVNAASKDVLGLNKEIPELSIFHKPTPHATPAAHAAPAAAAPAAAHGGHH